MGASMAWLAGIQSVAGPDHLSRDRPCQDFGAFKILKDQSIVAVVSDGAGSAKYGGQGAQLTVETALKILETGVADQFVPRVQARLTKEAMKLSADLSDFACTCVAIVASSTQMTVFQVGDGFAVARFEEDYELLVSPHKGEHINETCFITDKDAAQVIQKKQFNRLPKFISIATDGLENVALFYQTWKPHKGFFSPLDQYINKTNRQKDAAHEIESFLASPKLREKSSDDKTLFICGWQEQ